MPSRPRGFQSRFTPKWPFYRQLNSSRQVVYSKCTFTIYECCRQPFVRNNTSLTRNNKEHNRALLRSRFKFPYELFFDCHFYLAKETTTTVVNRTEPALISLYQSNETTTSSITLEQQNSTRLQGRLRASAVNFENYSVNLNKFNSLNKKSKFGLFFVSFDNAFSQ